MAMIPQPRRRPRAGDGRATALDTLSFDPRRPRGMLLAPKGGRADSDASGSASRIENILSEFTARWQHGESPTIEEYLPQLDSEASSDAMELIYHAYCLAESAGTAPDPADYIHRYPAQGRALERLFGLHRAVDNSLLRLWADPSVLPEVGDEIGPYRLIRELGEGGFARVFLAEQSDLDQRLVVVKVSSRITPEPRLLARARHSHIVEVLWHSLIDDGLLQLICMPFSGGATLAAVLTGRKRRGGPSRSGRDLLADLDRVSAPEYPTADLTRPAREILADLSYPKAVAWIVARLAEALDFAFGRGVLHGDLKPSNILLTADGTPMLLDFNLSVGWRLASGDDLPEDAGGTLAYMAPERLLALADPQDEAVPSAADRHRADIFSMGMVLLEVLAGRPPDHPRGSPRPPRDLASAFALSRRQGSETLIRSCRVAIAPPLRSILNRCLAPDPADRYNRASELAEDLDRWCGDRPLAFAREPYWCFGFGFGIPRRARRRLSMAVVALSLVVGGVGTLLFWGAGQSSLQEKARVKLSNLWDDINSRAFRFGQVAHWRNEETDVPEDAFRHLAYYNVLKDDDWRARDEFRALPESERADLEVWLLEQAFRLGRALRQWPDAPDDWRRGLEALERVMASRPMVPLETQCRLLRRQLGSPEAPPAVALPLAAGTEPPPRWMVEYLLGVEAEPLRALDALNHYRNVLRERPESFWGHYRAAAVAHRLGDSAAAADHLEHCIALRPENPMLRGQLAGCLYDLHRFDAALEQCDKALVLNPDHAEIYRTRAFIRGRLGQGAGLRFDISRFELLTRRLGKIPSWRFRMDWMLSQTSDSDGPGPRDGVLLDPTLSQRLLTADPDDVDLRTALAKQLMETGHPDVALAEFDKVLEINPDHLRARYLRGGILYNRHPDQAEGDFLYLLEHPRFEELLRESPRALRAFHYVTPTLLKKGEVDKAISMARRGVEYADQIKQSQGESHYHLARAFAVAARSDPEQLQEAALHLHKARSYNREFYLEWFGQDAFFEGQQAKIRRLVDRIDQPVD